MSTLEAVQQELRVLATLGSDRAIHALNHLVAPDIFSTLKAAEAGRLSVDQAVEQILETA
jgi:hypothetical protein